MHPKNSAYIAAILFEITDPNLQCLPFGLLESFLKIDIDDRTGKGNNRTNPILFRPTLEGFCDKGVQFG